MRVAVIAVTPVIVIRTLLGSFLTEPSWYIRWPAALVITILYLRFAVRALAEDASAASPAAPAVS